MTAPAEIRIEGRTITVRCGYKKEFVHALKAAIPPEHRDWSPYAREWTITHTPGFEAIVRTLLARYFPEGPINPERGPGKPTPSATGPEPAIPPEIWDRLRTSPTEGPSGEDRDPSPGMAELVAKLAEMEAEANAEMRRRDEMRRELHERQEAISRLQKRLQELAVENTKLRQEKALGGFMNDFYRERADRFPGGGADGFVGGGGPWRPAGGAGGAGDPYRVLGLLPNAENEAIRAVYRSLSQKHHPDHGGDPSKQRELNQAYAEICKSRGI